MVRVVTEQRQSREEAETGDKEQIQNTKEVETERGWYRVRAGAECGQRGDRAERAEQSGDRAGR
jgi:hypothetical protein